MYELVDDNAHTLDTPETETRREGGVGADAGAVIYEPLRPSGQPELTGGDDPDALYRAAGAADSVRRGRRGAVCPCCGRGARRAIRVRDERTGGWSAVCAMCAAAILSVRPDALVGGAVRPLRRRKRTMRDAG